MSSLNARQGKWGTWCMSVWVNWAGSHCPRQWARDPWGNGNHCPRRRLSPRCCSSGMCDRGNQAWSWTDPWEILVHCPPDSRKAQEWSISGRAYCVCWPSHWTTLPPLQPKPMSVFPSCLSLSAYLLEGHDATCSGSGQPVWARRHVFLDVAWTPLEQCF